MNGKEFAWLAAGVLAATGVAPAPAGAQFNVKQKWHDVVCGSNADRCLVGDFDGNGRDDLAVIGSLGNVAVAESTGRAFGTPAAWTVLNAAFGRLPVGTGFEYRAGDVNGDGRDDLVVFTRGSTADVHVALALASRQFTLGINWHTSFAPVADTPMLGDVNGDGCADLVGFNKGLFADVSVAKAQPCTGGFAFSFGPARLWHNFFSPLAEQPLVADFDGDGMADVGSVVGLNNGSTYVARSFGRARNAFQCEAGNPACIARTLWHSGLCRDAGKRCFAADVNGDGQADLAELNTTPGAPAQRAYLSDGTRFSTGSLALAVPCNAADTCLVGDFDGNSRDDFLALTRQSANPGDAFVTLSGGDHEVLHCTAPGCNGVLAFPSHGWVDTDVRLSDLSNGPHTIGFRVLLQFPNSERNAMITHSPHRTFGDYAIAKHASGSAQGDLPSLDTSFSASANWQNPNVSDGAFSGGVWYHVAVTISDGVQRTYIDGVKAAPTAGVTLPASWNDNSTSTFRIGAGAGATTRQLLWRSSPDALYGLIDNVAIYNRALSDSEISNDLRNRTTWTGNESGLVAAWTFDNVASPPSNPRLARALVFHGNAKRVTLNPGQTPAVALLPVIHDTTSSLFPPGSNYEFFPPLAPGVWTVPTNQGQDSGPWGSHRGYAAFCLDLFKPFPGISRGAEVRASARGQVQFVRSDSLDEPNLPPYGAGGTCLFQGGCGAYRSVGGGQVRVVQGCTPCPDNPGGCDYLGNVVLLRHGPNQQTGYLHLREFSVPQAILNKLECYYDPNCTGDSIVAAGERLGEIGRSGAGGDHLHFGHGYREGLAWLLESWGDALGSEGSNGTLATLPPANGEFGFGLNSSRRSRTTAAFGCGQNPSVPNTWDIITRPILFSRYTFNGGTVSNRVPLPDEIFLTP